MIRLLITGVSGLLGLNLAWQVRDRHEVTGVLRGERAVAAPGQTPFQVIPADLTQPGSLERVLDLAQPDAIIHCAALTDVDICEQQREEAYEANTRLPGLVAHAAARCGTRLLHISTDAIFDGARGDYCEDDVPNPINVYAQTKLAGERAVREAYPEALIARVNFYGWSWQGRRSLSEYFFNNLSVGNPVYGFDDLVFCPLLVNDLIEILLRMLECKLSGVYHVVSAEAQSKFSFGRMLAREFGFDETLVSPAPHNRVSMRAARSPVLTLRTEKLSDALGITLPGQGQAMRRYVDLFHQGYPQTLRSALVKPDQYLAG